jgi:hypothetical protein
MTETTEDQGTAVQRDIADAAAAGDLQRLYRTWCTRYVPDDHMAALRVPCTIADFMAWMDAIRENWITGGEAAPLDLDGLTVVGLQGEILSVLEHLLLAARGLLRHTHAELHTTDKPAPPVVAPDR